MNDGERKLVSRGKCNGLLCIGDSTVRGKWWEEMGNVKSEF